MTVQINAVGKKCLEEFEVDTTVSAFCRLSKRFTLETRIASPEALKAIEAAEEFGQASMSMLGNSVFAFGKVDELEEVLQEFGRTFRTRIDPQGPRLVI
jgi:pantoate kinase